MLVALFQAIDNLMMTIILWHPIQGFIAWSQCEASSYLCLHTITILSLGSACSSPSHVLTRKSDHDDIQDFGLEFLKTSNGLWLTISWLWFWVAARDMFLCLVLQDSKRANDDCHSLGHLLSATHGESATVTAPVWFLHVHLDCMHWYHTYLHHTATAHGWC